MIRSFTRLFRLGLLASCLMPAVLAIPGRSSWVPLAILTCVAVVVAAGLLRLLTKLEPAIDRSAKAQAEFLASIRPGLLDAAIVASAALSLLLELALIRWQGTVFEFFAFYKNFGLLSCFIGLGLGYALAARDRIPLALVIPAMAWQFLFMIGVRYGLGSVAEDNLRNLPFREQLNMGLDVSNLSQTFALYALLSIVFLMTALTFVPIGQLCGRLMESRPKLRAYGLNLAGSLVGVVTMLVASFFWTPPVVWFGLCLLAILWFQPRGTPLAAGLAFAALCIIALVWPVNPLWNRIYSPYQLLEVGNNPETGLTLIRAAGHYYQRVHDFGAGRADPRFTAIHSYYDFPYRAKPHPSSVAIVGAGTGNDVSAAVRAGAASVDAIEIDPAILTVGRANHPEHPYSSDHVHAAVNDARSFLRTTDHRYDLIVYGLLDSHTLLSQASSVRLDSFVYTVEGLKEARARLQPDGVLSLSFSVLSDALGHKIYKMLQEAFDGRYPSCVIAGYDGAVIFMESNDPTWSLPPEVLQGTGFQDGAGRYGALSLEADLSTDDWPFFYMPRRVYPTSYLVIVAQVLLLSLFVTRAFLAERPQFRHLSFFFLGAGFMLVETKGITEMGLTFGNTWQVIGVVIAGVLVMAFLGNLAVDRFNIRGNVVPYLLLLASLALGWFVSNAGGFASTPTGRLETAVVLTCPLFFSGIVFSALLRSEGAVSGMMAMNLLGATCGGLLEYNSMYFGFRSLYILAGVCYAIAFGLDLFSRASSAQAGRTCPAPTSAKSP